MTAPVVLAMGCERATAVSERRRDPALPPLRQRCCRDGIPFRPTLSRTLVVVKPEVVRQQAFKPDNVGILS